MFPPKYNEGHVNESDWTDEGVGQRENLRGVTVRGVEINLVATRRL
jgi:hypothetical protein